MDDEPFACGTYVPSLLSFSFQLSDDCFVKDFTHGVFVLALKAVSFGEFWILLKVDVFKAKHIGKLMKKMFRLTGELW